VTSLNSKDFIISRQSSTRDWHEDLHSERLSLTTNSCPPDPLSDVLIQAYGEEQELSALVVAAVESERFRLAHELHDGVGQILTGAVMLTEALRADLSGSTKKDADRILELIRKATLQVRSLSHATSPEFLKGRDLSELLAEEVAYLHAYHPVTCYLDISLNLSDEATILQLYRITQEAAHNALRHGRANVIQIRVHQDDDSHGVLEIINDGASLPSASSAVSGGIGLRGMKHRAALIQASLDVENNFTEGVIVTCRFPLLEPRP